MERVVVTGIGIISSIGIGRDKFWKNAVAGKNGISRVQKFDTSQYRSNLGGEIKEFTPYIKTINPETIGKSAQYAVSAASMAYDDAGAEKISELSANAGVYMGSSLGESGELSNAIQGLIQNDKDAVAKSILKFPAHNIVAAVCEELNLRSDVAAISNACAAGNSALICAYERIRSGKVKYAFAGGSDMFSEQEHITFSRLRALAKDVCSPFDKNRQGMAVGEGAAVLFLENYSSAVSRSAEIYAEIIGYGMTCDAYHMVMPRPDADGIKRAMTEAIETSVISSDDVDYICAHGTGTASNDKAEAFAINEVFKRRVPTSSVKSMIGHAMGAASAIEAVVCCMAIREGVIPPTINYREKDELCDIDCVPNIARHTPVHIAINNAYGFGGNNTCVTFRGVR